MPEEREKQNQTNKYNITAKQTYRRSLTRKDPLTGKSNYPTLVVVKATTANYINNVKRTITRNYRKLIPNVNN